MANPCIGIAAAAAERAIDPSIMLIHRDMAQRHCDMLNSQADPVHLDAVMDEAKGEAFAEPGSIPA